VRTQLKPTMTLVGPTSPSGVTVPLWRKQTRRAGGSRRRLQGGRFRPWIENATGRTERLPVGLYGLGWSVGRSTAPPIRRAAPPTPLGAAAVCAGGVTAVNGGARRSADVPES
jgi:hypothetical protein